MKYLKEPLLIAIAIFIFTGCLQNDCCIDSYEVLEETKVISESTTETKELPSFPFSTLHILQREYYHVSKRENDFNISEGAYIEKRLIELYPEKAFSGMYEIAMEQMLYYENLVKELNENNSNTEFEEYRPVTTLEAEIDYMNMTSEEIDLFNKYEEYANKEDLVTRDKLDDIHQREVSRSGVIVLQAIITAAVLLGYAIFRVMQSRNRAEDLSEEHFPERTGAGQVGDAFRHIYVSMHLRRYLSQVASFAIMDGYEVINPNENARDTYMDIHNNKVGRDDLYWVFRGDLIGDLHNWEGWGRNVRNWILTRGNGVDMEALFLWLTNNPDSETCEQDEESVSDLNFIFYVR